MGYQKKNTIAGFLEVDGDGEAAVLPAGHVEVRLRLGPQREELARHVRHLGESSASTSWSPGGVVVLTPPPCSQTSARRTPSMLSSAGTLSSGKLSTGADGRPLILLVVLHSWL